MCCEGRGRGIHYSPTTRRAYQRGNAMRHLMSAAALLLALGPAAAQDYPTKPITIIVPAAAGGPTDTISRITAQAMSKLLGQTDHDRECRRRGRHHRHHARGARRAGRLHAADLSRRAFDRRHALPQAALRHAAGVHLDRARHRCADDDHRAQRLRAQHSERAGRSI